MLYFVNENFEILEKTYKRIYGELSLHTEYEGDTPLEEKFNSECYHELNNLKERLYDYADLFEKFKETLNEEDYKELIQNNFEYDFFEEVLSEQEFNSIKEYDFEYYDEYLSFIVDNYFEYYLLTDMKKYKKYQEYAIEENEYENECIKQKKIERENKIRLHNESYPIHDGDQEKAIELAKKINDKSKNLTIDFFLKNKDDFKFVGSHTSSSKWYNSYDGELNGRSTYAKFVHQNVYDWVKELQKIRKANQYNNDFDFYTTRYTYVLEIEADHENDFHGSGTSYEIVK